MEPEIGPFAPAFSLLYSSFPELTTILIFTTALIGAVSRFYARPLTRMPVAPRSIGNDADRDFIKRFTERESQNRITKRRPKELTAAQCAGLRRQLRDIRFLKPAYADNSKINIAGILRKWKKYCESTDKAMAMDFLDYLCDTYKIASWAKKSTRQVATICEFQWHDAVLIPLYGLRPPNADGKPVLGTDDLLALLTFNLAYNTGVFPLEAHRIQLSSAYLALTYTGARPAEIVDNEKSKPKDGSWEEIFGSNLIDDPDEKAQDDNASR
ncbi:hypothetical protein QBC34DRAFT_430912, partial [Podospora aff. communis PSN243]